MYAEGDVDNGIISCGQGIGLAHDLPTVAGLFDQMISDAEAMHHKLSA